MPSSSSPTTTGPTITTNHSASAGARPPRYPRPQIARPAPPSSTTVTAPLPVGLGVAGAHGGRDRSWSRVTWMHGPDHPSPTPARVRLGLCRSSTRPPPASTTPAPWSSASTEDVPLAVGFRWGLMTDPTIRH
jgi:hypothetical protein